MGINLIIGAAERALQNSSLNEEAKLDISRMLKTEYLGKINIGHGDQFGIYNLGQAVQVFYDEECKEHGGLKRSAIIDKASPKEVITFVRYASSLIEQNPNITSNELKELTLGYLNQ